MATPKNICRCCLSEGCYKDISSEYYYSGQKEVYADMLYDTFNITISYQEGGGPSTESRLICDSCIHRLRDASSFKQLVQTSESNIVSYLLQHMVKCDESEVAPDVLSADLEQANSIDFCDSYQDDVKDEIIYSDLDLDDAIDEDAMNGFDDKGEVLVIKMLPASKNTTTKSEKKATKSLKSKKRLKENSPTRKPIKKIKNNEKTSTERRKLLKTPRTKFNMKENTLKLVMLSNICLFKSLKVKYQCFFCTEAYLHIKELRIHSEIHKDKKEKVLKLKRSHAFKLAEITDLRCNMCQDAFENIENLQNHLVTCHSIQFEQGGHFLIPYKIEKEFVCIICKDRFNTFVRLLIHMNKHYTNHVCETCGVSFINKLSLRLHVKSKHRERKCKFCPMTFTSSYSCVKHVVKVHDPTREAKRYCLICNKTFKYSYLLFEHKVKEHGEVRRTATCQECNKTFISANNLKIHIRKVHLQERNHQCSYCTMRFFTTTDQKRHERTHVIDEKDMIVCSHCDAKFKSKDSWRRHVNKQHPRLPPVK